MTGQSLATVSIEVDLPPAVAPPQDNPPVPVYITLQPGGRVFLGDNPTSIDSLGTDLRSAIPGRNPERERIFIRGDRNVYYRDFMGVLNALQDNGFYSVALIGKDEG